MQMRFPVGKSLTLTIFLCMLSIIPLSAQQQNGGQPNTGTKPATGSEKSEVRVEKFKVKQEFGPQSVSRRGDRTTTATPPSQGSGNNNQGASAATSHQEFGPTVHDSRKDTSTAPSPGGSGGKPQSTSAQNTQTSAPK